MKKILISILFMCSLFIISSCSGNNLETSIVACKFVDALIDDRSTLVMAENKDSIQTLIDESKKYEYPESKEQKGIMVDDDSNESELAGFYAVVSNKKFDIYVCIDSIPNDVKSIELEVGNDININGVNCNKGDSYNIEVEGTKLYFVLSVEFSKNTTIKLISLRDLDGNKYVIDNCIYSIKRANEIEFIGVFDLVTFDDSFNTFRINDCSSIEFTSIKYNQQLYQEINNDYSFDVSTSYTIKYKYNANGVILNCDRTYEKRANGIYYIGQNSGMFIRKFE